MSLVGKSIVVTRDASQAKSFVRQLKNRGAEVFQFPTLQITDVDDRNQVVETVGDKSQFDWIIFTSANAVKYFLSYADFRHESIQKLKVACVGNKTADLLAEFGLRPELTPEKYTTRDLLIALQEYDLNGNRILLPVSNLSRPELEQGLQDLGAQVQRIEVYKNIPYNNPKKKILYKRICDDLVDCITFFSPSALNSFIDIMDNDVVGLINSRNIILAVIGPTTAQAVLEGGMRPTIQPEKSDSHGLVQAMEQYYANI